MNRAPCHLSLLTTITLVLGCAPEPTAPRANPSATGGATASAESTDGKAVAESDAPGASGGAATPASTDPWAAAEPGKLSLVLANWEQTERRIATHKGKVVVVDFWSTWCTPCLREFPNLVTLQQQFPETVVCMSVNCNYAGAVDEPAEGSRDVVRKFLTEKDANFEHALCTDADTDLLAKIKAVAVPVVQVYDKQGQLRKQFMNEDGEFGDEGFEYAKHIVPLVEQLLAE